MKLTPTAIRRLQINRPTAIGPMTLKEVASARQLCDFEQKYFVGCTIVTSEAFPYGNNTGEYIVIFTRESFGTSQEGEPEQLASEE